MRVQGEKGRVAGWEVGGGGRKGSSSFFLPALMPLTAHATMSCLPSFSFSFHALTNCPCQNHKSHMSTEQGENLE